MEEKLPRWNIDKIYPGVESGKFLNDLKKLDEITKCLERISPDDKFPLVEILEKNNEGEAISTNLYAYIEALLSTDTTNASYLKALSAVEKSVTEFSSSQDLVIYYVARREKEFDREELKNYSLTLNEIKVRAEHQMSLENEKLAGEFLRLSSSAWSRLQDSVTSSISEGGETLVELRGKAMNSDRSVRRDAFEREIKILRSNEIALAAALNGVKGTVLLLEEKRGWNDPLERSIFSSRITRKSLDALLMAMEESRGMFGEYLKIKAKLLGLDKLDFYDLFAPVGSVTRTYSFKEARELVIKAYANFDSEAGAFVKKAFDENWIDAQMHRGKVGGAYDTFFPLEKESRVFCNYEGSYDSVTTLAHELGHAFHDSQVKDLEMHETEYPMTLAETASIFGETLLFEDILKSVESDEQLSIIEAYVQGACQVIIDILSRFYFEREVFKRRKDGDIPAKELCDIMLEAEQRAYGENLGLKHPYMWAVKSHYYSESFSFYNYPYAFGELFALGLFALKDEKENFPDLYKNLLKNTGRMNAVDLAKSVGIDIEDKAFWEKGLGVIGKYIKRLESWL